jgi:hypothetical protein
MKLGLENEVNHVFPQPAKARLKKELPDSRISRLGMP